MENRNDHHPEKKLPGAELGNASNPSPDNEMPSVPNQYNQLLNKNAETYLREAGNIEDIPDAKEQADAINEMKKDNR